MRPLRLNNNNMIAAQPRVQKYPGSNTVTLSDMLSQTSCMPQLTFERNLPASAYWWMVADMVSMSPQHAPCFHIFTFLTVRPRLLPSPHVGNQLSMLSQNSLGAVGLWLPHGLFPTPSGKNPFVPPTATFRMR